jgi:hypothetical protein
MHGWQLAYTSKRQVAVATLLQRKQKSVFDPVMSLHCAALLVALGVSLLSCGDNSPYNGVVDGYLVALGLHVDHDAALCSLQEPVVTRSQEEALAMIEVRSHYVTLCHVTAS